MVHGGDARLEIEGSALAHLDGERFGALPVRFEVVPVALRIASARVGA
jgi:diacylglycerol kinase family enzyme